MDSAKIQKRELSHAKDSGYNAGQSHPFNSRYRLLRELGHGAQGKIYLAKRLYDDKDVVVKQLNIHSIKSWKEYELFHREAEVLESLSIPGVARFYDAIDCLDDDPPCSYIVQEYIQGVSLLEMIKKGHRFKMDDVYDILIQILRILDRLHHHTPPIIHRDIKPSNIMLSPLDKFGRFRVTVIDFGAVANPQVQCGGSTVAGTFGYMPPEQLTGNPVPASDIYALGAMAVQLFCGIAPGELPTKDFRLIFEPEMQDKPHDLVVLLGQMLDPKVDQRLSDVEEIIERLQDIRSGRVLALETKQSTTYTVGFEKKLSEVRWIGQNGNVELWQQLPDTLPRLIPAYYANIIDEYSNAIKMLVGRKVDENSILKSIEKKEALNEKIDHFLKDKVRKVIKVTLGILVIFVIIVMVYVFNYSSLNSIQNSIMSLIIVLSLGVFFLEILFGVVVIIIKQIIALYCKTLYMPVAVKKQMLHTNRFGVAPENLVIQMHNLLINGRKTIATIDSVEYVQMQNPEALRVFQHRKSFQNRESSIRYAFFLAEKPLFKVSYRFNPPDDKRAADIVHTFITQSEPENHYCVGDPLPILYYIEDKAFYDVVTSMPFPLSELDLNEHTVGMIVDSSMGRQLTEDETVEVYVLKERLSGLCAKMPKDMDEFNGKNNISYLFNHQALTSSNYIKTRELVEMTQRFLNAQTLSELNEAVSMSLSFVRTDNEPERLVELIAYLRKILMERRAYPCHANCIYVLSQIAFSVSSSNQSSVDEAISSGAFDVIKDYMSLKPSCLTAEISKQLVSIREYAGFDQRYEGEFTQLLFDILKDPMVSDDARTVIIQDLYEENSLEIIRKTLDIIRDMEYAYKDDVQKLLELLVIDLSADVFCKGSFE